MIHLSVRQTIRGRLLILAIGVEVLMLTILVSNSLRLLHGAMTNQARSQAAQFHPVLEAALTAPLLQRDFATVQAVVNESRATGGVDYIVVVDRSGKRVASNGWPAEKSLPAASKEFPLFETKKEPRYDVEAPISRDNQIIGTIHFGINLREIVAARKQLLTQGIGIAAIEIVFSSIILLLIGYWLTRHLTLLTEASQQVASGNLSPPPMSEGDDDIGQMGKAFNTMSRVIAERVNELTTAKLAAEASEQVRYKSEERLKLALAGADMGLWDWEIITDRFTYSQEWTGLMGYDSGELDSGINARESLIHPEDLPVVRNTLQQHINGILPIYETEHRCRNRSGEWRWILDRGRVVEWDLDGNPTRLAGTNLDISDRKRAESKLRELNEVLEKRVQDEVRKNREKDAYMLHQDKMASVGQLAAGVAHEINNPMAFINSNLITMEGYVATIRHQFNHYRTMIRKYCPDEDLQRIEIENTNQDIMFIMEDIGPLISESLEGAERVTRIVMDLKDFARTDDNSAKQTDLNQCVKSTVNIVQNEIKYVADIDLKLGNIPMVFCSASQINQVIANLLINAAHSLHSRGTISVSTRQEGDLVLLKIADTGCGMTVDVLKRIFEPFFTTKEVGKGTGLGLTISYGIIKEHGGDIKVESKPGNGSIFTVSLPINGSKEAGHE